MIKSRDLIKIAISCLSKAESFTIDYHFMIRRYHVYKDIWSSFIEEVLFCCHDEGTGEASFKLSTAAKQKCPLF